MGDTPAGSIAGIVPNAIDVALQLPGGLTMNNENDEESTAAVAPAPHPEAIEPLSPDPPRWRFINDAKKSLGYSSIHAGSYVRGKSSDELGANYIAPDTSSLHRPREERAKPRKVTFELPTIETSPKAVADVGRLDASALPESEIPDRCVGVGKLRIEESSRGAVDLPSGDFAGLPKSALGSTTARKPYKEWNVRVGAGPRGEERERKWYDGNVHDSYAMPGDDESRKSRAGVGKLNFRDPERVEEVFVGEPRVMRGGEGSREGGKGPKGRFDSRVGELYIHPGDSANGKDADSTTESAGDSTTARTRPTLDSRKKSMRKWICLLIFFLLPLLIILGVLVGMSRSAPAEGMGSVLLPPIIAANETTSAPSSSPSSGASSEPTSTPSLVFGDPLPSTIQPTSQRICSKERDFNICLAIDMSGSVCNDGDGSDCVSCPGATFLSTIGFASECRDTSVSEDTCCTNFAKVKEFSSIMVNSLGNFPAEKLFSVVQFATDAQLVRALSSADDTVLTIDGLEYTGGMTNHESAIQTCQQTLPPFDDRKNFIMLITDGLSSVPEFDPESAAEAAATNAKSDGSFIIPVFISPDNDLSALEFMSRLSSDGIVFDVTNFDTLTSLQDRLIDQVSCS